MKNGSDSGIDFYRTSKFDWILIGLILFFAIASIIWTTPVCSRQTLQARRALIYQRNTLLGQVGLERDKMITIVNGKMQIEVKNGKLRVLNSDCPQHLCVNMGWIQYSGQTIVCAPNKVLIEIESTSSPLLDAVVY